MQVEGSTLHIVMEFCDDGDLEGVVKRQRELGSSLGEDEVMRIFVQLTLALKYVHSRTSPKAGARARIIISQTPRGTSFEAFFLWCFEGKKRKTARERLEQARFCTGTSSRRTSS